MQTQQAQDRYPAAMIPRTPWFQRSFDGGIPPDILPNLLERLRGTPARISERLTDLPPATLTRRENQSWSIQENVGHLRDLEELWAKRLADFLAGREELTPADLENTKTTTAGHNDKDLSTIVVGFRTAREAFVASLEKLTTEDLERTSLHPRLKQPMTILGMSP